MSDLGRIPAPKGASIPTGADEIFRLFVRGLSKAQRQYVAAGCIHGDCTMQTVRALVRKGLFRLVIDSPNGNAGFMRLTPLGENVRDHLRDARK